MFSVGRLFSLFLGVCVLGGAPGHTQNAAWDIAKRAMETHYNDCSFFSDTDDACRSLFSAFDQAMAHPEADAALEHSVLLSYLRARSSFGERLRRTGRVQDSERELMIGFQMMVRHLDGGRHFHTIIENQDLHLQIVLTMDSLGKHSERDTIISNLRGAIDSFERGSANVKSAGRTDLLRTAYLGAYKFEEALAKHIAKSAGFATIDDSLGDDDRQEAVARERAQQAIKAYGRAEAWLRRQSEEGFGAAWSNDQASLLREQAALCVDFCEESDLRRFTARWLAASCRAIPSDDKDLFEPALANVLPGYVDTEGCEGAQMAWAVLNGALDDAIDEEFRRQLQILKDAAEEGALSSQ